MTKSLGRFAPLMGVVAVVLWVVAILIGESGDKPADDAPGAEIATWMQHDSTTILLAATFLGIGSAAFIWFLGSVSDHFRGDGEGRLATVVMAAGPSAVATWTLFIAPAAAGALADDNLDRTLSPQAVARENARTVRDFIPRETWEQVNELYLYAKGNLASGLGHRRRYEYLRGIILGVQQITGLLAGTMTHDEGYDMLRMGRNLERADMTIRIIDVRTANLLPEMSKELTPFENIQWMSVLKSLSAYQMYRRAMQVRVRRPDVLRFLFKERLFPRAFYHTVSEVESCLRHLPRRELPLRCVSDLKERVTAAHPENFDQAELHEFIDTLEIGLIDLNRAISDTYFLANISSA